MERININWIGYDPQVVPFYSEIEKNNPVLSFLFTEKPVDHRQSDLYIVDVNCFSKSSSFFDAETAPPSIIYGEKELIFQTALIANCADAIPLPLHEQELVYRIHKNAVSSSIDFGIGSVSFSPSELIGPHGRVLIPHNQYLLLRLFSHNPGTVYSRKTIAQYTGMKEADGSRVVDVHVSKLRNDLSSVLGCTGFFNPILGIRRKGYRIEKKLVDNLCIIGD